MQRDRRDFGDEARLGRDVHDCFVKREDDVTGFHIEGTVIARCGFDVDLDVETLRPDGETSEENIVPSDLGEGVHAVDGAEIYSERIQENGVIVTDVGVEFRRRYRGGERRNTGSAANG